MAADVLVFDDKEVQDMSTFEDPHQYSKGFRYVIVNGKLAVENGTHTGVRSGIVLTGPGINKIL
jgi:N-acyl-D-amino-acid deacylase